jgi:flavin reductase (DIM6/NTAB) family NADH-FMN oxidoreductase RutF
MPNHHSSGGTGTQGRRYRQLIGAGRGQIQEVRFDAGANQCVAPPLVAECFANFECKVVDTQLVNKFNVFVLEVIKAWTDLAQKHPKTIHHHGYGKFAVDGEMIKLKSRKP